VLYAPTWSPYSSLHEAGDSIIASLAKLGGNVIVKLHDRSYERSARASGTIDWRSRMEEVCRRHGAHLAQGFDAAPYLFVTDALVTDHSSVGFEFMLLDRPVVVIDCPVLIEKAVVNRDKVAMLRSASEVTTADGAATAVRRSLGDPGQLSGRRKQVAAELFYCPGTATIRAARSIYGLLGLCTPDALPSEAAPTSRAPSSPHRLPSEEYLPCVK
jgi:hypothetical protein